MLRNKQDIENAKLAIKKYECDLQRKLNQVFKLAVHFAKNKAKVHVEIWEYGIMFSGLGIDISSPFHSVRLNPYEWECLGYDGGESLIDYYKTQISIVERWLELMKKESRKTK